MDTIFEISLRFRRCEHNRSYKFPFVEESFIEEDEGEEFPELKSRREGDDLVYDLHLQNLQSTVMRIPSLRKHHALSPTPKTVTEPADREKARSLSRRVKKHLLGRMEEQNLVLTKEKFASHRMVTESALTSQKNSARRLMSHKLKQGPKTHRSSSLKKICRTEESPGKKALGLSEFHNDTLRKLSSRLRTEKSKEKKSRMETMVSEELRRVTKQEDLIKSVASALRIKPKNLFQKNLY